MCTAYSARCVVQESTDQACPNSEPDRSMISECKVGRKIFLAQCIQIIMNLLKWELL